MVIHVFTQVSDYAVEFIRMLTGKFDVECHLVVFRNKTKSEEVDGKYPVKIMFLETRMELRSTMPALLQNADQIVFHSFPVSRSLFFWYRYRKFFNKAIWAVWGQDAYWYNYCKKTLDNRLYEWIRTRLIRRLHTILCPVKGDYDFILNHYKTAASYQPGMYPIPTDFSVLRQMRTAKKSNKLFNIQVGNSANPTNNSIEVIRFLGKHLSNQCRVFCPLSYGDKDYAKKVIEFGKNELGDNFIPMTTFLGREEYAAFVASVDILIMNHQRQQGLGNIFSYLFLGKKVYIRSDNSSFPFFKDHGIVVYDTKALLNNGDIGQLMEVNLQVSHANMMRTEELISIDTLKQGWSEIFTAK
jgi:hypothetical protein